MSSSVNAPERGNSIMGSSDVTAIGMASVVHQIAIQRVEAKTAFPWSDNPSKLNR